MISSSPSKSEAAALKNIQRMFTMHLTGYFSYRNYRKLYNLCRFDLLLLRPTRPNEFSFKLHIPAFICSHCNLSFTAQYLLPSKSLRPMIPRPRLDSKSKSFLIMQFQLWNKITLGMPQCPSPAYSCADLKRYLGGEELFPLTVYGIVKDDAFKGKLKIEEVSSQCCFLTFGLHQ